MADWYLRVTRRCLVEDLDSSPEEVGAPLSEIAARNDIVQAFADRRSNHPEGQEIVTGLRTNKVIFTLHVGDHRGATWFQKSAIDKDGVPITPPVVWLLAARFHRSGKPEDAYPYFRELDAKGRLLPTADDVKALLALTHRSLAESLVEEVPYLIEEAKRSPGRIQSAVLGDRVPVRLVYEPSDTPMLTVAISQRVRPGDMTMPPDWLLLIAAAFLPETRIERLSFAPDLAGSPLGPDEVAFCDFAEQ
jgi:hypothetical protein